MSNFSQIPQSTFEEMQLNAGMLLKTFDPTGVTAVKDADIICATTGGITASCVPKYSDLGADVDNCPESTKELKHLDGWDCKMSFTSLGVAPSHIKMALGAADVDSDNASMITPRSSLKQEDFADVWWVGDRADGGFVAIQLKNALSTGGFSLKTTKNGKGNISVELTGHVSISAQTEVPMVFYSKEAAA